MSILNRIKFKNCRIAFLWLILILFLILIVLSFVNVNEKNDSEERDNAFGNRTLLGGYFTLDPYQYLESDHGLKTLTGLDIKLMKAIAYDAEYQVKYQDIPWKKQLLDIKEGTIDFASGAAFTDERAQFAYYTIPYRYEENSLFVLRNQSSQFSFQTIEELLDLLKTKKLKVAVIDGYIYADPLINDYINKAENIELVIKTQNDYESLNLLINQEVSGFLSDRIVGATVIWRSHLGDKVTEFPLNIKTPIHIIFSKKTIPLNVVEKFNSVIQKFKDSTEYEKIVSWYLYPVLLLQTIDTRWFVVIEIIGTIAFAISGLLIAVREKSTLFGALILAILPSLGGGLMRDVILGQNPVRVLRFPVYLISVIVTVLLGFLFIKAWGYLKRYYSFPRKWTKSFSKHGMNLLIITDALGLSTFTVVGVIICILAKADPLWLWGPFFAFLTGAGGGILRDMLSKTRYIASLEGELYAEISIFWGFVLSIAILYSTKNIQADFIEYAVIFTLLGAFLSRVSAYFFGVPNIHFGK